MVIDQPDIHNETKKIIQPLHKAGDYKVLSKIALSGGLLLIMVVAPLLWGFLPRGYAVLNANEMIKANPYFTVFMRMATSFVLTLVAFGVVWLSFGVLRKRSKVGFSQIRGKTWALIKERLPWLLLLSVCYFGSRAMEMKLILTYSIKDGAAVAEGTAGALKDYGYFMGLMLALLFAVKNNALYGAVARLFSKSAPDFAKNVRDRLCCGRMSFVGKIFWCSTLFLTVASGVLYISAKEPLYVWPFIANMSAIACLVALLTSFGTDFKILGNVNSGEAAGDCPAWLPALVASLVVNFFQSGGTTVLAFVTWFFTAPENVKFLALFPQYLRGGNFVALVVVIGLFGSLIAPVSQLFGVNLHDAKLKRIGMTRYGVTGGDWLMICGGFEPLFVVLLGVCWPRPEDKLVSLCPMLVAVATVAVIALLKIAEVWSEKSSVVRNRIFTNVRGSTQDDHSGVSAAELRVRALKLSYLKFYSKRKELASMDLGLSTLLPIGDIKSLSSPANGVAASSFLTFITNGQYYFTQDDPFTNTVLAAHEKYMEKFIDENNLPRVEVKSLKRYLKSIGISGEDWCDTLRPKAQKLADEQGISGKDSMPYVILTNDQSVAKTVAAEWNSLLAEIRDAVKNGELDAYVNGMIVDMKGE